jgi:hypothetical protein
MTDDLFLFHTSTRNDSGFLLMFNGLLPAFYNVWFLSPPRPPLKFANATIVPTHPQSPERDFNSEDD